MKGSRSVAIGCSRAGRTIGDLGAKKAEVQNELGRYVLMSIVTISIGYD